MIQINCGCNVEDYDNVVDIRIKSETICMVSGVVPSVGYLTVCKDCYRQEYSKREDLILTEEEEREWLDCKFVGKEGIE